MQRTYIFDGKRFSSKSAIDKYIKEIKMQIIEFSGYSPINSDNKWFKFLNEIVNVNTSCIEKIGAGIKFFYFVRDIYGNYQLRIKRVDGTTIDVSMIYSKITQTDNAIKHRRQLNDAFRYSVYDDTNSFRKACTDFTCKLCGKECTTSEINVDHIFAFSRIRDKFLSSRNDIPTDFDDDVEYSCRSLFRKTDNKFENDWIKYHREKATFQILCRKCNIMKGAKDNIF